MNKANKILVLLKRNPRGVTNITLNNICFRYSARIYDLRREGYNITSTRLKYGVFLYQLNEEDTTM